MGAVERYRGVLIPSVATGRGGGGSVKKNLIFENNFNVIFQWLENTEGNVTLYYFHGPFQTLKKKGINIRNVGFV